MRKYILFRFIYSIWLKKIVKPILARMKTLITSSGFFQIFDCTIMIFIPTAKLKKLVFVINISYDFGVGYLKND